MYLFMHPPSILRVAAALCLRLVRPSARARFTSLQRKRQHRNGEENRMRRQKRKETSEKFNCRYKSTSCKSTDKIAESTVVYIALVGRLIRREITASDFTVSSPIQPTHLGIWARGSTWRRHTGKHGSSAPHQCITQPTS